MYHLFGVAAFNIEGHTLRSLLSLPTKGEYKDLEGKHLHHMQQSLVEMQYLIIDEMSMIGRKTFSQIDKRLLQAFPHYADQLFGGCFCLLFGNFGYECCHLYEFYQNLSLYNNNETYQFQSTLTNQETQLTSDERRFRPNSAQQYLQSCDLMRTYYYSPDMLLLA